MDRVTTGVSVLLAMMVTILTLPPALLVLAATVCSAVWMRSCERSTVVGTMVVPDIMVCMVTPAWPDETQELHSMLTATPPQSTIESRTFLQ